MKPNYLLIPEIILSNKNINALDKFVYGAIYWYSQMEKGKCIASNAAIAGVVYSTAATVANSLTNLEKAGLIRREYVGESKGTRAEIVPLVIFQMNGGVNPQMGEGSPIDKQSSKREEEANTTNVVLGNLHKNYGSTAIKRIAAVYGIFWKDKFGFAYKITSWGKFGKTTNSLLSQYSEYQLALLISVHFQWRGTNGQDEREYQFLSKNGFPLEMLLTKHNIYVAYIKNVLGIDFEKVEDVIKEVDKELSIAKEQTI